MKSNGRKLRVRWASSLLITVLVGASLTALALTSGHAGSHDDPASPPWFGQSQNSNIGINVDVDNVVQIANTGWGCCYWPHDSWGWPHDGWGWPHDDWGCCYGPHHSWGWPHDSW